MAAKKKTTKTPSKAQAEKKAARAAIEEAALAAAARLDGMRLVELLGARYDDPRVAPLLTELGHVKPLTADVFDVEFKKLGLRLCVRDDTLDQVIFEIRRAWTGSKRFLGQLPYGLSSDLKVTDAAAAIAGVTGTPTANNWYRYRFPELEVSIGFGKTFLETVFVARKGKTGWAD